MFNMLDISDLNSKNGDSTFKTMDLGMKLIAISNPNLSLSRFWFLPLALGLCNAGDCILHPRKPFCIYIYQFVALDRQTALTQTQNAKKCFIKIKQL